MIPGIDPKIDIAFKKVFGSERFRNSCFRFSVVTEEELTLALTRRGEPTWDEADFQRLLDPLGCAGLGWLRPEGVKRELQKMAADWQGPPALPGD